jgi:acetyl esterase/lipase
MALRGPSTVISVDYRLSPAHQYPIPINDGWDAFEYIVTNLPTLLPKHGASVRVVISGTSSGGQIAAIVSQKARDWMRDPTKTTAAAGVTISGVLLRAPVTVRGTDAALIPPCFRDLHQSWTEELETKLNRQGMAENHGSCGI